MAVYNHYQELNKDILLQEEDFISDASAFLLDRGGYQPEELSTDEKVYDAFMEHFRFQNVNEVTAVNDMLYAQNTDEQGKERMARLMDTYDRMDSDLGLKAAGDYVTGVLTAPSTYAGIFTGGGAKVGALAAQQGVKLGIREILKRGVAGEALRKAATQGAVRAGAVEGAVGAGQVVAQEQARVETGMQEGIRGGAVALGAVAGAVPGAVFGAGQQVQRAITGNVSERVARLTEKRTVRSLKNANKTVVKEVFENKTTSDTAKNIYENLKETKLALKETIPEELAKGKELKAELAPDDVEVLGSTMNPAPRLPLEATIEDMKLQNIAAVAAKIVDAVPDIAGEEGTERFTSKLVRALTGGTTTVKDKDGNLISQKFDGDTLTALVKKYGVTLEDIGSLLGAEASSAGSLLGTLGSLKKKATKLQLQDFSKQLDSLDKAFIEMGDIVNPAREVVEELDAQLGKSIPKKVNDFFNLDNINKARIGLMTVQLATTARNMTNGYMRNYIYAFDNFGAGMYNKAFSESVAKRKLKQRGIYTPTDKEIKDEAVRAVNLGKAQLRTAYDSVLFKDLMTVTSAETTALGKLMKNPLFGQSEQAQRLFMEMGDVADHTKIDSGWLKTARFLNKLNTKSDNMFKRAILSREIDKSVRAAGYEDGLNGVLKSGRFAEIDPKVIAEGMEKALDFTYQTGKFKGKEGAFNQAAQVFIDASQTKLGSTFVPFPRYLVNQFRFFYEHAPLLGMVDAFGILNKSDFGDRVGKQIGGAVMLSSLYVLRANHGDETTGPFEYKNPFGSGLVDAQASLGPFSAYAWAADAIYKISNPDAVSPITFREFTKSLGGGQFRPTGLNIVDGLFDTYQRKVDDGETDLVIKEAGAKFLGNYMNTFTVGAGVLKDVVATLDPEFRVTADNTDIKFWPYVFKQATRSFPQAVDENSNFYGYSGLGPQRRALQSPTRSTGLRTMNPFMRQLTGLTQREQRNLAELEFDRLGLQWTDVSPRKVKFDPELTGDVRGKMGRMVESAITDMILNDPVYKGLETATEKQQYLKSNLRELKSEARSRVLNIEQVRGASVEEQQRFARANFYNYSSDDRDLITIYYERDTGKKLKDTDDYMTALAIGRKYQIKK